jgi:hypothetical protein
VALGHPLKSGIWAAATTAVVVLVAIKDVLFTQTDKLTSRHFARTFNVCNSTERPTASALTLVLDWIHGSTCDPINAVE